MKVYHHKLVVEVISLDPNPASVACTIDGVLTNLQTRHPLGRILMSDAAPTFEPSTREYTIPDEPFNRGVQAHDDWTNNHVYGLLERKR